MRRAATRPGGVCGKWREVMEGRWAWLYNDGEEVSIAMSRVREEEQEEVFETKLTKGKKKKNLKRIGWLQHPLYIVLFLSWVGLLFLKRCDVLTPSWCGL